MLGRPARLGLFLAAILPLILSRGCVYDKVFRGRFIFLNLSRQPIRSIKLLIGSSLQRSINSALTTGETPWNQPPCSVATELLDGQGQVHPDSPGHGHTLQWNEVIEIAWEDPSGSAKSQLLPYDEFSIDMDRDDMMIEFTSDGRPRLTVVHNKANDTGIINFLKRLDLWGYVLAGAVGFVVAILLKTGSPSDTPHPATDAKAVTPRQ